MRVPSYRRHKASGNAVVTINARDIYLGKFNSAASRQEYNRLIAEWTAGNGVLPEPTADITVCELLVAFLRHAKTYHTQREQENFGLAMRPVKALYGKATIAEFGPRALKAVRQQMIDSELARSTINKRINRIRHIFKWGVENELVPANVLHGLQAVGGLQYGRSNAREAKPVKPVPEAFINAVLPYVSPQVRAMLQLQLLTGMRSGEVTGMRACDINTAGDVWLYTVALHKTAWRGHERKVYLGPQAQAIIRPFLRADTQAYLFAPADAVLRIHQSRHAKRRTPLSCGNKPGSNLKCSPRKQAGNRYDTHSYRRALTYGVNAANKARLVEAKAAGIPADKIELIPQWHPHQLRHNAATNLRRGHGIEVARIILGHRSPAITEVYAEVDHARAIEIMGRVG